MEKILIIQGDVIKRISVKYRSPLALENNFLMPLKEENSNWNRNMKFPKQNTFNLSAPTSNIIARERRKRHSFLLYNPCSSKRITFLVQDQRQSVYLLVEALWGSWGIRQFDYFPACELVENCLLFMAEKNNYVPWRVRIAKLGQIS